MVLQLTTACRPMGIGLLSLLAAILTGGGQTLAQPVPGKPSTQALPRPAAAPEKPAEPKSKLQEPMTFARVRADGEDCRTPETCPEWIALEGRIMAGQSANQLRRIINGLGNTKLPIVIASPGGSVEEGYAMARFIRAKGLSIAVGFTEIIPCPTGDKACATQAQRGIRRGRILAKPTPCASACVFVLAGGVQRHVSAQSGVGVHQYQARVTTVRVIQHYRLIPDPWGGAPKKEIVSTERIPQKTENVATRTSVYDRSAAFFREMGIDDSIMVPLRATPHDKIHWLTRIEVEKTKIATDRRPVREVLGLATEASMRRPQSPTGVPGQAVVGGFAIPGSSGPDSSNGAGPAAQLAQVISPGFSTMAQPPASPRVIRELQDQLRSAQCLDGPSLPVWGSRSRDAVASFATAAGVTLDAQSPSIDLLTEIIRLRGTKSTTCADIAD